jgi:hypothetical protein
MWSVEHGGALQGSTSLIGVCAEAPQWQNSVGSRLLAPTRLHKRIRAWLNKATSRYTNGSLADEVVTESYTRDLIIEPPAHDQEKEDRK